MLYDLHIHSCLSPCAEDDMTPATVAGMAKLAGADLIAITDHNSARNLPAAEIACKAYGLRLLPGIEVNTEEEIHLLCYFPSVQKAMQMSDALYAALPALPYDPAVWGRQLVCNEDDAVLDAVEKLLTGAVQMNIYQAVRLCQSLGGVAVPAHADKDSFSLLSVLGFCPEDLPFTAVEMADPAQYPALAAKHFLPAGCEILHSSDAHQLADIARHLQPLAADSVLQKLL